MEKLIRRITEERQRQRLSQSELARMVGTTRQAISNLEKGRFNPSPDLAKKIYRALGLTEEEAVRDLGILPDTKAARHNAWADKLIERAEQLNQDDKAALEAFIDALLGRKKKAKPHNIRIS